MCILIVIGWIIAAIVWANFGPVWGIIVFVLFGLSGFGWVLLAGGIGSLWALTSPKLHQFRKVWKQLDCDAQLGGAFDDYFAEWARIYRPEGRSASAYLSSKIEARRARISEVANRFLNDEAFQADVFKRQVLRSLEDSGVSEELIDAAREWTPDSSGPTDEDASADTEGALDRRYMMAKLDEEWKLWLETQDEGDEEEYSADDEEE